MLKSYYQFAGNNRHFLLFGLVTAFFGNYGQSFFIAWFGASFQADFNLSNTEYGMVYSSATLVSGFLILYVGGLLDKTPLKKFTFFTSLGLLSACVLLFIAEDVWQLVLAIFLLRFCGQGLMFHIAFTSMARYFNENRGKAIGIVGFGMPIGEALLPIVAITLITMIGWRHTWLILGVFFACCFLPLMSWLINQSKDLLEQSTKQSEKQATNQAAQSNWTRKDVVKDARFWLLMPSIMAPAFIVTGIFIHQSALLSVKGWTEQWFAIAFTVYAVSHLLASLVIGSLVDQYSGKKLLRYYLIPMFLGVVLLALPFNFEVMALLFMFLAGLTIGASGPIVGSLWVEIYGNKSIGAIRSTVTSIMVLSTAVSPILFGWLLDNGHSFSNVMTYLVGYILLAWLLSDKCALNMKFFK
jgi:MFS transporter, OFA family, oxalate/formate antiporter